MSIGFISSTVAALGQTNSLTIRFWKIGFWTIAAGGETAAWHLKWIAIPISITVLWSARYLVKSIKQDRTRFTGLSWAQSGLTAAIMVTVLIAALIGITIPERLRQRQDGIEAAMRARGYALHRAFLEYRDLHGTLPSQDFIKELRTLPDPDGSIADALRFVDPNGYQPSAVLAAVSPKGKPLVQSGAALRNATSRPNPDPPTVSFTSYELRLPSEHRLLGGDDDFIMRDGIIVKASEVPQSFGRTRPGTP